MKTLQIKRSIWSSFSCATIKPPTAACAFYLDVKLQIALVHLSGNHALDHVHWHQLIALVGWAEDIMSITFLNLDVEEALPACSAELVSAGHVHWIFKHRDRAETDSTLEAQKQMTE